MEQIVAQSMSLISRSRYKDANRLGESTRATPIPPMCHPSLDEPLCPKSHVHGARSIKSYFVFSLTQSRAGDLVRSYSAFDVASHQRSG
jgi:hypothetical protein